MGGGHEGLIFDLKKYSINDGPGIRTTVFFKGCPLRCRWCHNPEGQSFAPEIMIRASRCLVDCSECITACPEDAIVKAAGVPVLDRRKCNACGKCTDVCPAEAMGGRRPAGPLRRRTPTNAYLPNTPLPRSWRSSPPRQRGRTPTETPAQYLRRTGRNWYPLLGCRQPF